ncbi:MAG: response regulator transcription factor [Flavobacteriales bacterium]|nr:response regulator transcription factor [Flavobacteriales bacterium]
MSQSTAIQVILADDQFLTRKGLASLINEEESIQVVAEASTKQELYKHTLIHHPEVVIINYDDDAFTLDDITGLRNLEPNTYFLAITPDQTKFRIQDAIDAGVTGHILKRCSREEILDAIHATAKGEKFFCSKVVDTLMKNGGDTGTTRASEVTCDPVNLSERELEIIRMVADGLTNKEIADKLFISAHTVTTHRKNIMAKLELNNTAGLVMYAVKSGIVATGTE